MWILSLEFLLLAVLLFWCTGAMKRLKRLRGSCVHALQALDAQFVQAVELMRSCTRMQTLKEQVASVYVPHAQQALLASAEVLESAQQQALKHPLRPENVAALDVAWQGVQVAWQSYVQQCTGQSDMHNEHVQEWTQRWTQLQTLQNHCTAQFNAAMDLYNRSITQFPACALARLSGHRMGRTFQKDAAWSMQPTA